MQIKSIIRDYDHRNVIIPTHGVREPSTRSRAKLPREWRLHTKSLFIISIVILIVQFFFSCNTTVENKIENTSVEINESDILPFPSSINQAEKRFPLLVSKDFGETWEPATENLPEEIQASFIAQKENELVLASNNMGVFISSENKSKWKSIGDKLPNPKINALHISGGTIYVAIYRQGIYQTNDEGETWESLNHDLQNLSVQSILKWKDQLIIGTDEGIFLLNKNAWQETHVKSQVLSIYEFDNKLIAGTSQGTLLSTDKGKNWDWIRKEGAVHYTHNIGKRIVELILNGDVVYSDDWGKNWTNTPYKPRAGSYVYEIIECGDYQLMSNNYGIHRSKDNGKNWEHIFKTESMAFFDLIVIGNEIYGGTRAWDEYRKRRG